MSSLYIHIPFCLQKCKYCDFTSFENCDRNIRNTYINAVVKELSNIPACPFDTVFLGGGTPTALEAKGLQKILEAVMSHGVADDCEITVEANPETITYDYAKALKGMGVNRMSMGLQSADDKLLRAIGRVHSYERFLRAYEYLRYAGFDNINIDLMYGLPGQRANDFEDTIDRVIQLAPEHISAYALTLSEGTPMYDEVQEGRLEVLEAVDMEKPLELLKVKYCRYEISNYAIRGKECRHNLNYWHNGWYYGVGCGAHGCMTMEDAERMGASLKPGVAVRSENAADLGKYLSGEKPAFTFISSEESMFETVMLGLRLVKGVNEGAFRARYGEELYDIIGGYVEDNKDFIYRRDGYIRLTDRGMDIQNTILVELMSCFCY